MAARMALQMVKNLGNNAARAAAPTGWSFEDHRRIVRRSDTWQSRLPGWLSSKNVFEVLLGVLVILGWHFTWRKERGLRDAAALATGTASTSLSDLHRALRAPGEAPPTMPNPIAAEMAEPGRTDDANSGKLSITVRQMSGQAALGPLVVDSGSLVADTKSKVAEALGEASYAVRLLLGDRELDPSISMYAAGVQNGAELVVVISRDRVGIADALYARAVGTIWVGDNERVRAPFSLQWVVYCQATTVRMYDEWVTRRERRLLRAGRKATKDDPGEESEYEDVDVSHWEQREEVQNCQRVRAPHIYLDDGSEQRALIAPTNMHEWGDNNAVLTFQDTQNAQLGAGLALQAMIGHERERGYRREERCINVGEAAEIVGEARLTEHGIVLQEPSIPSQELHRVYSDNFSAVSQLQGKAFVGAVLRNQRSLAEVNQGAALRWRIAKWLAGALTLWRVIALVRRVRQARRPKLSVPA